MSHMSVAYPNEVIEFGMSAAELAYGLGTFLQAATARVLSTGRDQYEKRDRHGKPFQSFEEMTPLELLQMAREEVQDLGVYAAMLDIRLARLTAALQANATIGDAR